MSAIARNSLFDTVDMQFDGTVKSRQMITVLDKKKDNSTTSAWQKKKVKRGIKCPSQSKPPTNIQILFMYIMFRVGEGHLKLMRIYEV